jgi:hypothetical protein
MDQGKMPAGRIQRKGGVILRRHGVAESAQRSWNPAEAMLMEGMATLTDSCSRRSDSSRSRRTRSCRRCRVRTREYKVRRHWCASGIHRLSFIEPDQREGRQIRGDGIAAPGVQGWIHPRPSFQPGYCLRWDPQWRDRPSPSAPEGQGAPSLYLTVSTSAMTSSESFSC